jgi:tetratricopeptide (TPR) repeat protein
MRPVAENGEEGSSMSRNNRLIFFALLTGSLLLFGAAGWARQQQQPQPKRQKPPAQAVQPQEQEEYTEEEWDAYDKAAKEPDPDKRAAALAAFIDKYPKSKLMSYIVTSYQTLMYELQKGQQYAKLLPVSEQWLKLHPDDFPTIAYIAEAAQMLGQDKKFLEYGQKIYAVKPSGQLALYLTQSFEKVGDHAKYLEWIEKVMAYPEFNDNFGMRMIFVKKYADEKNFALAASWAQEALKSLDLAKKSEKASEADWCKETTLVRRVANYLIGLNYYEKEKYAEAIKAMNTALKAEQFDNAYYYIGLSQWKLDKVEDAINSFGKAVQLKG